MRVDVEEMQGQGEEKRNNVITRGIPDFAE